MKRTAEKEADSDMLPEYDFSKPLSIGRHAALCAGGTTTTIIMENGRRRIVKRTAAEIANGPGAARRRKAWRDRIFGILSAHGRPMSVREIVEVLRKDGMLGSDRQIGALVNEALSADRRIRKVRRVVCELA